MMGDPSPQFIIMLVLGIILLIVAFRAANIQMKANRKRAEEQKEALRNAVLITGTEQPADTEQPTISDLDTDGNLPTNSDRDAAAPPIVDPAAHGSDTQADRRTAPPASRPTGESDPS